MNYEKYRFQVAARRRRTVQFLQQEQTELSGLLGGLGWKCEQTGPQHSAAAGLQRSGVEQATVQDMTEANRLLQQVKKKKKVDKPYESSVFLLRTVLR